MIYSDRVLKMFHINSIIVYVALGICRKVTDSSVQSYQLFSCSPLMSDCLSNEACKAESKSSYAALSAKLILNSS